MAVGSKGASVAPKSSGKDLDDKELVLSLVTSLATLTASYFLSKWIVSRLQGLAQPDGGDMDGFLRSGGQVVVRLKRLLVARHEVTLKTMLDELEEGRVASTHRAAPPSNGQNEETRGNGDDEDPCNGNEDDEDLEAHARLQAELQLRHQRALSTLDSLTPYEVLVAQGNVVDPSDIPVTFADVGGVDDIKAEIYDLVVVPLLRPDLFVSASGLVSPPKGILLYG